MKLTLTTITLWVLSLGAFAQFEVPVPYNPDGNADGFITLPDLLDFLALYGGEYSPEALATDSSSAIIHMGQGDYFDCASWCAGLEGNWKVMDEILVGRYKDEISTMSLGGEVWMDKRSNAGVGHQYAPTLKISEWSVFARTYPSQKDCICQTRVIQPIVIQSGPCQGNVDLCGICDGPGPVYECGCFEIPEGACDCEGNQLDALGICGGDCLGDFDGDGICDYAGDGPCDGLDVLTYQGVDYDIVEIGGRCWFADDLKATHYQDGSPIVEGTSSTWEDLGDQFMGALYDVSNESPGGGYAYNWYALQAYGGVCPTGWHVPSLSEYDQMKQAVYNMDNALVGWQGVQFSLKSSNVFDGDNASGFNASPTKRVIPNSNAAVQQETFSMTWTTSPASGNQSWTFFVRSGEISQDQPHNFQDSQGKSMGLDVRCIKDAE